MKAYKFDSKVELKYPNFAFYGVSIDGVEVTKPLQFVTAQKKKILSDFREKYTAENISQVSQVKAIRDLFNLMGINPDEDPTAVENLTRLLYRGGLPNINSVVDSCNLASIGSLMPVGVFDADKIVGNLVMRLSIAGETYDPIGMKTLSLADDILVLSDDQGIIARPMYKDSSRTMITLETKNILIFTAQYPPICIEDINFALDLAKQIVATSSKGVVGEMFQFRAD